MNRTQLSRFIGVTGHSLGQVEKDRFQHIVLAALSQSHAAELVFKGGTALQKMGLVRRFSEDLDFTLRGRLVRQDPRPVLAALRGAALGSLKVRGITVTADREIADERTIGFRLRIQGPLYRNRHGLCTLRIETSRREEVLLPSESIELDPPYPDVWPYTLAFMAKEEIMAEKVRTLLTREKPRDLYDLWSLAQIGTRPDIGCIERKLAYYEMAYSGEELIERAQALERSWDEDLSYLIESVPAFPEVIKVLEKMVAEMGMAGGDGG